MDKIFQKMPKSERYQKQDLTDFKCMTVSLDIFRDFQETFQGVGVHNIGVGVHNIGAGVCGHVAVTRFLMIDDAFKGFYIISI